MSRLLSRSVLALLAALFLLAVPAAAQGPRQPYVVLVGIDRYKDPAILPRKFAEADIKALYDLLTSKTGAAIPKERVKLLLGGIDPVRQGELATTGNVTAALKWALESAQEDDVVLIAWSGQGGPAGDRTCYFTVDSAFKERGKEALAAGDLEQWLEKSKAAKICVFLDVNFRGYDAGGERIAEGGLDKRFNEFDGRDEGETRGKPVVFFGSGDGLKPSPETEKHSLFMTVVLDALSGKADTTGGEADGLVAVDELADYLRKELPMRALALGVKDYRPIVSGRAKHFPIAINPAAYQKAQERLARFEAVVKQGSWTPEVIREGRDFLTQMPRFDAQRALRKKYQELADGQITIEDFMRERAKYLQALQVPRAEAETFAARILRVANMASDNYVKPITVNELVAAAIRGIYRHVAEKPPKEIEDRLDKIKELDEKGLQTLLIDVRTQIGNRDDIKGNKAGHIALDLMLHSLDNYSTYVDPETKEQFDISTRQVFIGVGIQIQKDQGRDLVRVSTPLRGSPAYKAGIRAGDLILKVTNTVGKDGKPLAQPEVTDLKGMTISDVVKKILGKEGTPVTLTIERETADGPKIMEFTLVRNRIEVETMFGVKRNDDDSWEFYIDKANKIAYVRLNQFAQFTDRDLRSLLAELEKTGINGFILDLRFNPGGYLRSAVEISDLFIEDGLIVSIRPREGRGQEFKGRRQGSYLNFPLVVLVNNGSASASEIVSAAIQDHGRGIIMGERSFGKGSVQNIIDIDLGDGASEVKLTTASFWRPNGKNLNRFPTSKDEDDWGVVPHPDYTIKLNAVERGELFDHLRSIEIIPRRDHPNPPPPSKFEDRQLNMAVDYLRRQITAKPPEKKAG